MSYPGNASLSPEIQQRILSTFEQTRDLAAKGNQQEALLGCDFILRLDPAFSPAKELMQRLKDGPEEGPVEVADLEAEERQAAEPEAEGTGEEAAPPELDAGEVAPPAAPPLAAASALGAGLAELLERRELKRLVQVAEENRREVASDPQLRKLVETAYSRLEAEPYLESFLSSARQALQQGDSAEAERLVAKAKSLDPTHPEIAEVEQARTFYDDPARRMGSRRQGIEMEAAEEEEASAAAAFGGPPEEIERFELADEQAAAAGLAAADGELAQLEPPPPPAEIPPPEPALGGAPAEPAPAAAPAPEPTAPPRPQAPSRAASAGGDGRIQELLAEGQAAFDRQDYQDAIDSWSRIFLIDIDHQEAARRIEHARRLKAEGERRVEEVYHEAMSALDGGEAEAAREGFLRVLELQPNHLAAREYLQQLEGGEVPAPAPPPPTRVETVPVPEEEGDEDELLKEEIIVPPPPGVRPAAAVPPSPQGPAGSRRNFVAIGGAVLVLVLAVGAFAYLKRDSLFRNTQEEAVAPQTPDPVDRALKLYEAGEVEAALRRLRTVRPGQTRYQEALDLIARWEAPPEAAADAEAPPPAALVARRDGLLERARAAYARSEYLAALEAFGRAAEIAPLEGTVADLEADARRQLEPLAQPLDLFRQREWEFALRTLWGMHQADPDNRDVVRLMVDSYYNLAVRALQRYNTAEAAQHLEEALALEPGSPALERQKRFAETYSSRPHDLLYEIYIKYLPFRSFS